MNGVNKKYEAQMSKLETSSLHFFYRHGFEQVGSNSIKTDPNQVDSVWFGLDKIRLI